MNVYPLPDDSGPIYKETIMGRWPVEPWNTVSTLFFLALTLYWLWKIKNNWRQHPLIFMITPLIGVGFVGGFIYHSTRSHIFWLLLDWVPIVINANIASLYFWKILLKKWPQSIAAAYLPLVASIPLYTYGRFTSVIYASLAYAVLFLSVAVPLFLFAKKNQFSNSRTLLFAILSIASALILRTLDKTQIMDIFPMGTHFLWHSLGALTCHFLILYVYKTQQALN